MSGVFTRLRLFYRPYLRFLALSLLLLVVSTGLGLVYPYLIKVIINQVILERDFRMLLPLVGAILLSSLVKGIFNFAQQYTGQIFGSKTAFDLRNALYVKLNHQPFSFYDEIHTGDLMSRLTADLDVFRMFLAVGINNLAGLGMVLIFGLGMMASMNLWLALTVTCLMPVLALTVLRFDKQLRPIYRLIRKSLGTLNSGVQETIMGVRTVKSFAQENQEIDRFSQRNETYFAANMDATRLWKKFFPIIELTGNTGVVLILLVGGSLVFHHRLNLGDLVAFLSILWYMIGPLSNLGFFLSNWTQARAAGARLLEILEAPNSLEIPNQSTEEKSKIHKQKDAWNVQTKDPTAKSSSIRRPGTSSMRGWVQFNKVGLKYNDEWVLQDIDLSAEPGKTIALLGLTGAGKSSLVNMIPRFYDATSGQVCVEGKDVKNWSLQDLRRQVAIAFQEPFLFSTTVFANIAYGHPDATIAQIQRAAQLADASDFIEQLPEGYRTLVGERGLGLSGGQKQRVALARAIVMDPAVLILDDATSAVDMETEFEIQQALKQVMKGRTTFIIAHRISSLRRADEILVLDHGHIVQRGRHEQLLAQNGLYREIFEMQFQDIDTLSKSNQTPAKTEPNTIKIDTDELMVTNSTRRFPPACPPLSRTVARPIRR